MSEKYPVPASSHPRRRGISAISATPLPIAVCLAPCLTPTSGWSRELAQLEQLAQLERPRSCTSALPLRRLGRIGRLHRRPRGDRVIPSRQLWRGAAPIRPVAPVVIAAGDRGRDLRQVERRSEGWQVFFQGGEAAELAIAHLGDEVVRAL